MRIHGHLMKSIIGMMKFFRLTPLLEYCSCKHNVITHSIMMHDDTRLHTRSTIRRRRCLLTCFLHFPLIVRALEMHASVVQCPKAPAPCLMQTNLPGTCGVSQSGSAEDSFTVCVKHKHLGGSSSFNHDFITVQD